MASSVRATSQPEEKMRPARSLRELTIAELLARCSERPADQSAWQEFVRRFNPVIRTSVAAAFRIKANHDPDRKTQFSDDLIEDLVQTVYMKLVENGGQVLERCKNLHDNSIYKYLKVIAVNVVRDHFRDALALKRRKVCHSLDELVETGGEGALGQAGIVQPVIASAPGGAMPDIDYALVKAVSKKTRDRDIRIFKMRFEEGMEIEEIIRSLDLDLSPISVRAILNKILRKLKLILAANKGRVRLAS